MEKLIDEYELQYIEKMEDGDYLVVNMVNIVANPYDQGSVKIDVLYHGTDREEAWRYINASSIRNRRSGYKKSGGAIHYWNFPARQWHLCEDSRISPVPESF